MFDIVIDVKGPLTVPCDERYKQLGFETLNDLTSGFFCCSVIFEEQLTFTSTYLSTILKVDFFKIPGCQELYICEILKKKCFSQSDI